MKMFKTVNIILLSSLGFVGCQSQIIQPPVSTQPKVTLPEKTEPESKVTVTPYPDSGIKKESQPLPNTPHRIQIPTSSTVVQPIRQLRDGRGVAAYAKAMQDYTTALRQNRLNDAEGLLLQAQRMAPQSADVYRELARLSNLRKQATNAEAFARKGLTFAQTNLQKKQLWQQILQSAELQKSARLMQQAQREISRLN